MLPATEFPLASALRPPPDGAPSRAVEAFAVAVLVLATGAFFALSAGDGASSSLVLLLWSAAYATALAGMLDGWVRERQALPLPGALVAFVVVAGVSALWSVSPSVSLRRGVALGGTVAVGLFLAQKLRPVDLLDAVRRAAVVVAVASLLLYAVGDPRALDDVHRTLSGVVATKNTLARVMAIGLIVTAALAVLDRRHRLRCAVSAGPLLLALLLTDSAGGLVVASLGLTAVAATAIWRSDRGRSAAPALIFSGLGAVALLVPTGLSAARLLELTGRDPTLTGRTDIWAESLRAAAERPTLGAGYGAFWNEGSAEGAEAAARISSRLAEPVANAHNGFLDILLDTGLVGVALAAAVLALLFLQGVRDHQAGHPGTAALRIGVCLLVLVSTAAEGGLLKENSLLTVLIAVAAGSATGPGPRLVGRHRTSSHGPG